MTDTTEPTPIPLRPVEAPAAPEDVDPLAELPEADRKAILAEVERGRQIRDLGVGLVESILGEVRERGTHAAAVEGFARVNDVMVHVRELLDVVGTDLPGAGSLGLPQRRNPLLRRRKKSYGAEDSYAATAGSYPVNAETFGAHLLRELVGVGRAWSAAQARPKLDELVRAAAAARETGNTAVAEALDKAIEAQLLPPAPPPEITPPPVGAETDPDRDKIDADFEEA